MKALILVFFLTSFYSFGQIDHWETAVKETDTWNYMVPNSNLPSNWTEVGFGLVGWNQANGGFGYGDGDDNFIVPNATLSVYQRIDFTINDVSEIEAAAFTIDYDDSFVAYLNGVEIDRDLLNGIPPNWNDLATGLHEADIYQGNYPRQITLSNSLLSGLLVNGVNTLAVEVHNESSSSSDLSSRPYLHLALNTTGITYEAAQSWFIEPIIFQTSNLPIVIIDTYNGQGIPDDPKITATMSIINNGNGQLNNVLDSPNEYFGQIGIERRGSSSGGFAKKSYGLETQQPDSSNNNVSIFNWPADNDWVLYAPYSDKSLIRNVITYDIGRKMGRWAPRTQLCEVVLNGEYVGVYVFTEKIKNSPGRVGANELEWSDTLDHEITGGYVFKIDKTTSGGIISWTSPYSAAAPATGPISYQLHDPGIDIIHPLQEAYLENYITEFETALQGPDFEDPVNGYQPYIDLGSFVDFMIANEISKNVDGYRISTFYHKNHSIDDGKLHAGPLWDFNLAWGNANYCNGGLTDGWEIYFNDVCGGGGSLNNPFHWNRMVEDPVFTKALNCRWQELRQTTLHLDTLLNYIDGLAVELEQPANRNFSKWPVLGTYLWPNNFVGNTYLEEINYLKSWTTDRIAWLDANMFGTCPDLGLTHDEDFEMSIFPNPTNDQVQITIHSDINQIQIQLLSLDGKLLLEIPAAKKLNSISLANYATGVYVLRIKKGDLTLGYEKIIKN